MAETATLELPTFKGRAGWEFTELGDFTLEAWEPAPGDGTEFDASHLLEPPAGAIELVQVDGASAPTAPRTTAARSSCRCRSRASAIPSWSSRTSARSSATSTPSPRSTSRDWEGGAFVYVPAGVVVDARRSCSPPSARRRARSSTGAC